MAKLSKKKLEKSELINLVAKQSGVSRVAVSSVLDALSEVTLNTLPKANVSIPGLVEFSLVKRNPREARNPKTGETVHLGERYVANAKPMSNFTALATRVTESING